MYDHAKLSNNPATSGLIVGYSRSLRKIDAKIKVVDDSLSSFCTLLPRVP